MMHHHHSVDVARTREILARYRPIAPRPPTLDKPSDSPAAAPRAPPPRTPRARKRGRGAACALSPQKKYYRSTFVPVLPSSPDASSCHQAALAAFSRGFPVLLAKAGAPGDALALSLLPSGRQESLDLNADQAQDLTRRATAAVIVPQPVRPVGSTIHVADIKSSGDSFDAPKATRAVEEEVEAEALPAIVSDSGNRVRLANSAYREMVGQPECRWLESMVGGGSVARRIGGEVMLEGAVPSSGGGFSCRVRIEWTRGGERRCVRASCDVERVRCESKDDYVLAWRFHADETSVGSN